MLPDQPDSAGVEALNLEAPETVAETAPETEVAKPEAEEPKEFNATDELEKLRKAKARDDRRIGKLTAIKHQALKEADDLRKRLSDFEAKSNGKTPGSDRPKEDQFETYGEYLDALTDWKVDQRMSDREKKASEESAKQRKNEYSREKEDSINENAAKAAKEFADFNSVMDEYSEDLREMAPHVREAILEADNGAFALYMLAKEGELSKLNELHPLKVAGIIARMEDKAMAAPKARQVSKAPDPIKANSGTSPAKKTLDSMSGDELLKWVYSKK